MSASSPAVSGQQEKSPARKIAPRLFTASIAKKFITAVTGLFLCGFLVAHLLGNLLLMWATAGDSANRYNRFNQYAGFLNSLPFLSITELGLAAIFLMHAYQALKVTRENYQARPQRYAYKKWGRSKSPASRKSWSSTFMAVSGTIILIFVILHVWHFKYNKGQVAPELHTIGNSLNGAPTHDLAQIVVTAFKNPFVVFLYVAAMLNLGAHLWHAVWSAFQTLGVSNPKMRRVLIGFGNAFTIVITLGFLIIPIWAYTKADEPWANQPTSSAPVAQGSMRRASGLMRRGNGLSLTSPDEEKRARAAAAKADSISATHSTTAGEPR